MGSSSVRSATLRLEKACDPDGLAILLSKGQDARATLITEPEEILCHLPTLCESYSLLEK